MLFIMIYLNIILCIFYTSLWFWLEVLLEVLITKIVLKNDSRSRLPLLRNLVLIYWDDSPERERGDSLSSYRLLFQLSYHVNIYKMSHWLTGIATLFYTDKQLNVSYNHFETGQIFYHPSLIFCEYTVLQIPINLVCIAKNGKKLFVNTVSTCETLTWF